jgi:FkbM family methyltransferase
MRARQLMARVCRVVSPSAAGRMARAYPRFVSAGGNAMLYEGAQGLSGTLLDLGGYEGSWTADMLAHNPECRVFAFEPVDAYAEALRDRFIDDDRVRVSQFGLGDTTRSEALRVAGASSSIYRGTALEPTQPVVIVDVAEWWEEAGLESVAVMKINIEGGEYEVLPRLIESGLIGRIERVQVQFHAFVPRASRRMGAILHELGRTHEPVWRYPFVWESWRRTPSEAEAA